MRKCWLYTVLIVGPIIIARVTKKLIVRSSYAQENPSVNSIHEYHAISHKFVKNDFFLFAFVHQS